MNRYDLTWFKSSHSGGEGGDCLEVAFSWRTSSYSDGEGGQCVEVAVCAAVVHVRDSKAPAGPRLDLSPRVWGDFVSGVHVTPLTCSSG
ncbi:DUF397 domain-containing protein [Streptomyces antibioticus]|uniref:DUF397 domain-containing protein n=1 Tax=Streptomyces antibioticus TaxID=1890 RepID=UPI0033B51B8C